MQLFEQARASLSSLSIDPALASTLSLICGSLLITNVLQVNLFVDLAVCIPPNPLHVPSGSAGTVNPSIHPKTRVKNNPPPPKHPASRPIPTAISSFTPCPADPVKPGCARSRSTDTVRLVERSLLLVDLNLGNAPTINPEAPLTLEAAVKVSKNLPMSRLLKLASPNSLLIPLMMSIVYSTVVLGKTTVPCKNIKDPSLVPWILSLPALSSVTKIL